MKKWLIGSLVGAIIVFGWMALSHTVMGLHSGDFKYTAAQSDLLNSMGSAFKEEAAYILPNAEKPADQEKVMEENIGKPWAMVIYHPSMSGEMVMTMVRGFLVTLVIVIILIYLLTRGGVPPPMRIFAASVALGLAFFLYGPYTGRIWYQMPWHMIKGDLIDDLAAWGLCGAWLSWWLPRK